MEKLRRQGYKPRDYYEKDEERYIGMTQIGSGVFNPEERTVTAIWLIRWNWRSLSGAGGLPQLRGLPGIRLDVRLAIVARKNG